MTIEMIEVEEFNQGTQIKVIGVGGGGSNAVEHMIARSVQGVEFVSANTDAQALTRSTAHRVIQLGQSGLGAGSKPEKAREAAEDKAAAQGPSARNSLAALVLTARDNVSIRRPRVALKYLARLGDALPAVEGPAEILRDLLSLQAMEQGGSATAGQ